MKKLSDFILYLDSLSIEPRFFINENKRHKNLFGGLLSLLAYIISFSAVVYFIISFFKGDNSTIIMDQQITNQVKIKSFQSYPLMLRLSAS